MARRDRQAKPTKSKQKPYKTNHKHCHFELFQRLAAEQNFRLGFAWKIRSESRSDSVAIRAITRQIWALRWR
jgi:hypothetical protein